MGRNARAGSFPAWGTMRLKGRRVILFPLKEWNVISHGVKLSSEETNYVTEEEFSWLCKHPQIGGFSIQIRKVPETEVHDLENR